MPASFLSASSFIKCQVQRILTLSWCGGPLLVPSVDLYVTGIKSVMKLMSLRLQSAEPSY